MIRRRNGSHPQPTSLPKDDPLSPPSPTVSAADRNRIVIGVLVCMLLAALDQTIVAPAIPAMGVTLGGSDYISWIVSAYFLTATATTPLYGKIADIHGRRPTLYTALAIFVGGSIMCALAPQMWVLILGRAIQGIGGGGLMALAQIVIADLVPPSERGKFAVHISGTWAIASVAGPILGGFLTEHLSWSVIFWLNLPLAALAVAMTFNTLTRVPWARREHKVDVLGAILVVGATAAFMLALAFGPQANIGWSSLTVIGLLAAAALLTPVTGWHMLRAPEPLVPIEVLRNPIVLLATATVFFSNAAFIALTVVVPLFLELVLDMNASQAGLGLLGFTVGTVISALYAGRIMARVEDYKQLPTAGLAIAGAGLAWLGLRAGHLGFVEAEVVLIIVGLGSGPQFPVTTVAVQNAVEPHNIGVATGMLQFMRALGSAVGVAIVGAVTTASGIVVGFSELGAHGASLHVGGGAFKAVFLAVGASAFLGMIFMAAMPGLPLRRAHPTPNAQASH
jgi:EmrB/QacA subfamily drug resistance transporter